MTALDPDTGELVGPASAVQALLDGRDTVDDPALAAALEAARAPAFRAWTEGGARGVTLLGDPEVAVMVTDRPSGAQGLLAAPTDHAAIALVVWLELGPRPVPGHAAIRLDPSAMAVVIGRREAHGHGLAPEVAADLQQRLDAGVRHWTLRVESGGGRRNLEVVDGPGGIWRVRPVGDLVELAPTSSTAVVRELVGLLRRAGRSTAP
jgi:hypothetical protein